MATKFVLPDNLTQDWLFNVGDAVNVGDLMYDNGSGVARPAAKFTSLLVEGLDQGAFAPLFIGVSQEAILSSETNALKRITIRTEGVVDITCPSLTFNQGDMLGVFSNGTVLSSQQVDKVTFKELAIGTNIKFYSGSVTTVRMYYKARRAYGENEKLNSIATLAAIGSAQNNSAPIVTNLVQVTGANATTGVVLPTPTPGMEITIANTAAAVLKVWPNVGAAINAGAANAAYSMTASVNQKFFAYSATQWYSIPLLGS